MPPADVPREPAAVEPTGAATPEISVVVPVYNAAAYLDETLGALAGSRSVRWECIVVDDGSTDDSAAVAERWGARVLRLAGPPGGPGQARNFGANEARAPLFCFIDADVVVRPETLAEFVALFRADPDLTAAFGSYDADPAAPGLVSRYRNLLHHHVHQSGREDAGTFWAGCGAIRRDDFLAVGGFDPAYRRPSIEDIELGTRLRAAGQRIRLAKHIQVQHLKHWSFGGMIATDIRNRAIPWTQLIVRTGEVPNDLNTGWSGRLSALSVFALAACLAAAPRARLARPLALAPAGALVALNWDLYSLFWRRGGPRFLAGAVLLHWLYFAYSAAAFALGSAYFKLRRDG